MIPHLLTEEILGRAGRTTRAVKKYLGGELCSSRARTFSLSPGGLKGGRIFAIPAA